jgi:hypothetical protein
MGVATAVGLGVGVALGFWASHLHAHNKAAVGDLAPSTAEQARPIEPALLVGPAIVGLLVATDR